MQKPVNQRSCLQQNERNLSKKKHEITEVDESFHFLDSRINKNGMQKRFREE